jgi:hypothetical protein
MFILNESSGELYFNSNGAAAGSGSGGGGFAVLRNSQEIGFGLSASDFELS